MGPGLRRGDEQGAMMNAYQKHFDKSINERDAFRDRSAMFHGLYEYRMQCINLLAWIFCRSDLPTEKQHVQKTKEKSTPHVTNTRLSQGT